MRAWRGFTPPPGATPAWNYYGSPERLKTTGVLAGAAACERSRKWGYRGSSRLGCKLKAGHHVGQRLDREDNVRPHAKKRGKGLSLVGHERVPRGFGLRTGDHGGDTADGAGNLGRAAGRNHESG